MIDAALSAPVRLPVGPMGRHATGWWGMATLIVTEAALFVFLLFAYFYSGATAHAGWLLEPSPNLELAAPATLLLLASSLMAWIGERGVLRQRRTQALVGLGLTVLMGSVFVAVQVVEWSTKTYGIGTSSYASLYYLTTGLDVAHVIVGIGVFAALFSWTALDYFSPRRSLVVSVGVLYWHFVTVVWLFVFTTYYVTPYLGFGR